MVELLENWMPLLPDWVMNNILESMVLPRLQQEVDAWDPTTDTIPTHSWIHPWLPLMGKLAPFQLGRPLPSSFPFFESPLKEMALLPATVHVCYLPSQRCPTPDRHSPVVGDSACCMGS